MALVEARDLVKRFGSLTAVDGISFAVDRAEVVGFLGPNGAGKSTAMKIISGFLEPTSGQALIEGYDSQTQPMEARRRRSDPATRRSCSGRRRCRPGRARAACRSAGR